MKRPFNFFYIWPAGAIRGDKNIAHRLHWRGRPGRQQPGGSAGCSVSRALFFCSSRANQGTGGTPPCLPYYGEQGRCKEKAGAVRNTGFGHEDSFLPVQGFCPCVRMRLCRAGGSGAGRRGCSRLPLRDSSPPLRPGAPGALAGAGRRAVLIRKGPRKTGALADVGLSGPQACAVPVRAASRKGDQPAGRPARRAPGSCRCCDRW